MKVCPGTAELADTGVRWPNCKPAGVEPAGVDTAGSTGGAGDVSRGRSARCEDDVEEEDDSIQEPTWSPMSAAQAFSAVFSQARAKLQLFRASQRYVDGSLRIADLSSQRSDQRRERQALQAISHAEMLLGTSVAIRSHLDLEHRNPTMAARAGRSLASIAHNTAGPVRGCVRYSTCVLGTAPQESVFIRLKDSWHTVPGTRQYCMFAARKLLREQFSSALFVPYINGILKPQGFQRCAIHVPQRTVRL